MEVGVTGGKQILVIIRDAGSTSETGPETTTEDEELPFALSPTTKLDYSTDENAISLERKYVENSSDSKRISSKTSSNCFSFYLKGDNLPDLKSSIVSSETGASCYSHNSISLDTSLLNHSVYDSNYLDTAASLLCTEVASKVQTHERANELLSFSKSPQNRRNESLTLFDASQFQQSPSSVIESHCEEHRSVSKIFEAKNQSVEFEKQQQSTSRLPILPEEVSVASSYSDDFDRIELSTSDATTPIRSMRFSELNNGFSSRLLVPNPVLTTPADGSTTILPEAAELVINNQNFASLTSCQYRGLASLAGAVVNRTGNRSFRVTIDVSARRVSDIMNVLGNPGVLPLWFDPVMSGERLVITKSSEGARTEWIWREAADTNNLENNTIEREYEGEWVEATLLAPLKEPTSQNVNIASRLHQTCRLISSAVGCPTYGRISMFVERQKGNLSLVVGSFVGGIEIHHNIHLEALSTVDNRVRIIDAVRLRLDEDSERIKSNAFCDVSSVLQRCYVPNICDYMDQVLTSMARLRFLVENGAVAELPLETEMQPSNRYEHCPLTIPLLPPVH